MKYLAAWLVYFGPSMSKSKKFLTIKNGARKHVYGFFEDNEFGRKKALLHLKKLNKNNPNEKYFID